MQPITQASLDPESKDIRHLLADQSLEGVLECSGLSPPHPLFRTSHRYFESYHLCCKITCFPWKNEGFEATLATHKTTHQVPRQRTRRRSMCKHARAWTCRKAKAIGQKCEKSWGTQGFGTERTGTEQPTSSLRKVGVPK